MRSVSTLILFAFVALASTVTALPNNNVYGARSPAPSKRLEARAPVPSKRFAARAPVPSKRYATPVQARAPVPSKRAPQPSKRAPQPSKRAPQPSKRAPQPSKRAPAPQPSKRAPQPQPSKRAPQPQPSKRAPQPQPSKRAIHDQIAVADPTYDFEELNAVSSTHDVTYLAESLCPGVMNACPLEQVSALPSSMDAWEEVGFECFDLSVDLRSCGGCGSVNVSHDCTAIPGALGVSCVSGACHVESCAKGYKLSAYTGTCVPA